MQHELEAALKANQDDALKAGERDEIEKLTKIIKAHQDYAATFAGVVVLEKQQKHAEAVNESLARSGPAASSMLAQLQELNEQDAVESAKDAEGVQASAAAGRQFVLALAVGIVLAAVAFGLVIARRITRPWG